MPSHIAVELHPLRVQLGEAIRELLNADFDRIVCAVAYAKVGAIARLADELDAHKAHIEAFCSKDNLCTSAQAVELLIRLGVNVYLLGSKSQRYHPKFWLAWSTKHQKFELILGSGNLTVGGMWRNIEASVRLVGNREDSSDRQVFDEVIERIGELRKYAGRSITEAEIPNLVVQGNLLDESVKYKAEPETVVGGPAKRGSVRIPLLGITRVPPVSSRSVGIVKTVPLTRPGRKRPPAKLTLAPDGFIMTLNRLKGPNIPGEIRIPLAASRAAEDFWGWPDAYVKDDSKKGTYYNRTPVPVWKIWIRGGKPVQQPARLYLYEESMDFRLYSTAIKERVGAVGGDIIIIWCSKESGVDYDVEIIPRGHPAYPQALSLCTEKVSGSDRRWGFLAAPSEP